MSLGRKKTLRKKTAISKTPPPPLNKSFDLVVVGSGPSGQRAAIQAAKNRKRVALIEGIARPGGACVFWGTIPSKAFRESVYRYSLSSRSKSASLPQMERLLERKNRVVSAESDIIADQLKRNGVELIHGWGRLAGPHSVEVISDYEQVTHRLESKYIILAVGARPVAPSTIPVDGEWIHDSNTILNLKRLPKKLVVLGAGIIGCEYASIFSTAGSKVVLVDKREEILTSVDSDIVQHLIERFESQKMEMRLGTETRKIELIRAKGSKRVQGVRVTLENGKRIDGDNCGRSREKGRRVLERRWRQLCLGMRGRGAKTRPPILPHP